MELTGTDKDTLGLGQSRTEWDILGQLGTLGDIVGWDHTPEYGEGSVHFPLSVPKYGNEIRN